MYIWVEIVYAFGQPGKKLNYSFGDVDVYPPLPKTMLQSFGSIFVRANFVLGRGGESEVARINETIVKFLVGRMYFS